MGNLVDPGELTKWLRYPVDPDAENIAIRVAQGWIRSVTQLSDWPDPVPEDLWASAIELSAMALENPSGLDTDTTGDNTMVYARARRGEILAVVARVYGGQARMPQGSFPLPEIDQQYSPYRGWFDWRSF